MQTRDVLLKQFLELRNRNSEQALTFLLEHYGNALYGVVNKILQNKELANDAFQEGMVKIWKNLSDFDPEKAQLFTWMMTILRNSAIDLLRQEKRKKIQNDSLSVYEGEETSVEINVPDYGLLSTISKLDQKYSELIELIYIEGYTQQEAAEKLQLPLGTVKTRIKTALNTLKNLLSAIGFLIINIFK